MKNIKKKKKNTIYSWYIYITGKSKLVDWKLLETKRKVSGLIVDKFSTQNSLAFLHTGRLPRVPNSTKYTKHLDTTWRRWTLNIHSRTPEASRRAGSALGVHKGRLLGAAKTYMVWRVVVRPTGIQWPHGWHRAAVKAQRETLGGPLWPWRGHRREPQGPGER